MDVRHEPLGESDKGVIYWYLDLGPCGHTSLTGAWSLSTSAVPSIAWRGVDVGCVSGIFECKVARASCLTGLAAFLWNPVYNTE